MKRLAKASWDGERYANEHCNKMFDRVFDTSEKYIAAIYSHNGVDERNCSAEVSNKIYYTAATPASIYTK